MPEQRAFYDACRAAGFDDIRDHNHPGAGDSRGVGPRRAGSWTFPVSGLGCGIIRASRCFWRAGQPGLGGLNAPCMQIAARYLDEGSSDGGKYSLFLASGMDVTGVPEVNAQLAGQ